MKAFAITSTLLSLTIFAGCTTNRPPPVVVQREFTKAKVPESYLAPCGGWWSKKGGPSVTQDFVDRGDVARSGLSCRDAQIAKIKEWNAAQ